MSNRYQRMGDYDIIVPDPNDFNGPPIPWIVILMIIFCPVGIPLLVRKIVRRTQRRRIVLYWRYASILRHRREVSFQELANKMQRPVSKVKRDIRHMFECGYFGNAYSVDEKAGKVLCMTNDSYVQAEEVDHTRSNVSRPDVVRGEPVRREPVVHEERPMNDPERKDPVRKEAVKKAAPSDVFNENLRKIRSLNDQIRDEAVSLKIDRIGMLTADIFATVQKMPERTGDIRKFMEYYLPTTFKLLEMYSMMEQQTYKSDEVLQSMQRIRDMLDSLIKAFEVQQSKLTHADAMDVDAEISALEGMLAADGLVLPKGADINDFLRTAN